MRVRANALVDTAIPCLHVREDELDSGGMTCERTVAADRLSLQETARRRRGIGRHGAPVFARKGGVKNGRGRIWS